VIGGAEDALALMAAFAADDGSATRLLDEICASRPRARAALTAMCAALSTVASLRDDGQGGVEAVPSAEWVGPRP
jgi:hypothetical protein